MSPQDRKDVLRDQVYLPRPNIASKEHVGLHEAAKKRLLEVKEAKNDIKWIRLLAGLYNV